jgi:hypothetical protein
MRNQSKRIVAGIAAVAAISSGLAFSSSGVVSAATEGTVVLSPASGPLGTVSVLPSPTPTFCSGDSANDGYRVQAFIAPAVDDPNTYTFSSNGPTNASGFSSVLFSPTGTPYSSITTAPVSGQLQNITNFNLGIYTSALVDGNYNIGFACTLANAATDTWFSPITVSGGNYGPLADTSAATPSIDSVVPSDGALKVTFTPGSPAGTSYELTATPQGGGAPVIVSGASSPLTVTGLANFTTYDLSLTATNAGGTNAPATATGTPEATEVVTGLTATPGQESVIIDFVGLAGATGYTLTTDAAGVGPFNLVDDGRFTVTGLAPGTVIAFTVTPVLPATRQFGPVTVSAAANPNSLIYQNVNVTRPQSALVLTQVCGVNGELSAAPAVAGFPGYPTLAAAVDAKTAPGTAPTLTVNGTDSDPLFGNYPQQGSFPTYCDLDLGTASLVTTGPLAGLYYQATGTLNQVTVLDNRDDNAGWTVTGKQLALSSGTTTDIIHGNYVGWYPEVTGTSTSQTVTAGVRVLPGSGINSGTGLADGSTLGSALAGQGQGIATMDAHVQILIPVGIDAGVYEGLLSLTII